MFDSLIKEGWSIEEIETMEEEFDRQFGDDSYFK